MRIFISQLQKWYHSKIVISSIQISHLFIFGSNFCFTFRLVYQKVLHCAKHETKINLRFLKTLLMNHFQNQFSIPFTNRSLNINIKNNFYNFISNVKINKIVSIFLIIDLNFFNFQTDNRFYFQLWPWLRATVSSLSAFVSCIDIQKLKKK